MPENLKYEWSRIPHFYRPYYVFSYSTGLLTAITIVNKILNRNLCSHIKFQNVMKSIAKLIETQFDLNYILPIIGELIDSFVSDHLIYIFIIYKCYHFNKYTT